MSLSPITPHPTVASQQPALLTIREVALALRVDDTTVRRWVLRGILVAIPLPHHGKRQTYRIPRSALDAVLQGN